MDKKYDSQKIDQKLYLALRNLYLDYEALANSGDAGNFDTNEPVWANARQAMDEFEASQGPLPDWAILRNWANEPIAGAQLCTKDGRRSGNAHILSVEEDINHGAVYSCITDAGSEIELTYAELDEMFWVGDYLSDPVEAVKRFKRPE